MIWSSDDSIVLGPDTTHEDFLEVLQRKLSDVKLSTESKAWIVAEVRGRKVWQFKEQVVDVTTESWGAVLRGLREGRFKDLRVICWRD